MTENQLTLWAARDPCGYVCLFGARPTYSPEHERWVCADDDPEGDAMMIGSFEVLPDLSPLEPRRVTLTLGEP